jgi:hypothetical protein
MLTVFLPRQGGSLVEPVRLGPLVYERKQKPEGGLPFFRRASADEGQPLIVELNRRPFSAVAVRFLGSGHVLKGTHTISLSDRPSFTDSLDSNPCYPPEVLAENTIRGIFWFSVLTAGIPWDTVPVLEQPGGPRP